MIYSALLFLVLALLGGYIGYKTKFPLGVVLGSMTAVGLGKMSGVLDLERTVAIGYFVQIALGITLGLSLIKIQKSVLMKAGKSFIVVIVIVLVFTFLSGIFIHWFTGYNLTLAILSVAPGAVVEVATLAQELNLDSPSVVLIHLTRVIVIMSIFPLFIRWGIKTINKAGGSDG